MPHAHEMHISQIPQACCMCPTCMPMQGACMPHTHHFTCHTHTACLWHSPCTHQTCHTHVTNLSYACCTCTAYLPLACQGWTLSKCTHSCLHRHTTCKNATSLLHIHCKHTQCMHAPGKQHSSCTHATLTCITDATYATCASMLQACQRHKLCACWNVCMYATLILNILQAH